MTVPPRESLPKVMLFDLDDTIVDYSRLARESWAEVGAEFSAAGATPFDPVALVTTIKAVSDWLFGDG